MVVGGPGGGASGGRDKDDEFKSRLMMFDLFTGFNTKRTDRDCNFIGLHLLGMFFWYTIDKALICSEGT